MNPNGDDNILYNFDAYLEYCVVTQTVWRFKQVRITKQEDYRQVFKALAENNAVEELSIRLQHLSSDEDAKLFLDALQQNTSLLKLTLYVDTEIMNPHMSALLDVLGEKNQLRELFMYDFEWNQVFAAFIRFLEKSSKLVSLQIPDATFTDIEYLQVLDVISKHNPLLVRTDLGEAEAFSDETVAKIATWLNNRPQHNVFEIYGADRKMEDFLNEEMRPKLYFQYAWGEVKVEVPAQLYLEPNSCQHFWEMLPRDMVKKILYQLNIGYLMAFLKSNKATIDLPRRWSFWKEYYLTYFSCVPNECLDIINLVIGHQWLPYSDVNEIKDFDIWREIVKILVTKTKQPNDFPVNRRELYQRIAGPVLRKYPQLVSELSEHVGYKNHHEISGYGHPALCFAWVFAAIPYTAWIHLGFEVLPSGRYNGIVLYGAESYLASISDRFQHVRYIFEWTTASSAEEFSEKIVPLVDVLMCGQELNNGCYWNSRSIGHELYAAIDRMMSTKRGELSPNLEKHAQKILDTCHVTFSNCVAFTRLIDSLTQVFKDAAEAPLPDYLALKQKVPSRAEMNHKYQIGPYHYNFNQRRWVVYDDEETQMTIVAPLRCSQREKKVSSSASLQRLIRVCMNYIMMPVLKAFWRLNASDPEYRVYPHLKGSLAEHTTKWPSAPLEHVSVSHAQPQAWPAIAVAVAQLIMRPVCRVIEAVVDRTWTSKQQQQEDQSPVQSRDTDDEVQTRVNELIGGLMRIGLMSNEHLAAIRVLFNKL